MTAPPSPPHIMPRVGEYFYQVSGRHYRIYRYTKVTSRASLASPVHSEQFFRNREDARRRVYELNGWEYK